MKKSIQLMSIVLAAGLAACGVDEPGSHAPAETQIEGPITPENTLMVGSGWDLNAIERAEGVVYMDDIYK